jgi:DNA-binding beta-propeller fold protein YncE
MAGGLKLVGHRTCTHLFKLWRTLEFRSSHSYAGPPKYRGQVLGRPARACAALIGALLLAAVGGGLGGQGEAATLATPSRSTTIALTSDETRLVVVNREANTVSIIRVKDAQGNDVAEKLAEIAVGLDPRCVAVHPNDEVAFVTNGLTADVTVVRLTDLRVVEDPTNPIKVGTEPRGCALTPNGQFLYVEPHGGHRVHH